MSDPSNHELNGSADLLFFDPDLSPDEHFVKLYRAGRESQADHGKTRVALEDNTAALRTLETRLEPVIAAHTRRTLAGQILKSAAVALGGLGGAAAGIIKVYEVFKTH